MIFDAKHEMIRKLVRQFAETELTTEVLDKVEETGEFPEEIVDKMAKCGFLGLKIPREYGGAGADTLAYIIMIEEIARVSAVASLYANTPNSLGGGPLMQAGTPEQLEKYLRPSVENKVKIVFGLTEPGAGSDASGMVTTAVKDGDDYILNGRKCFISGAPLADYCIVYAKTDMTKGNKGISAFIVDMKAPGVSCGKHEAKMGLVGYATSDVVLEDVRVHKNDMLGKENMGFINAMKTLDGGRLGVSAQSIGLAQGCLDEAQVLQGARPVRQAHLQEPGHRLHAGGHGHQADRRQGAGLYGRPDEGQKRPQRLHVLLHGQVLRLRDLQRDRGQGRADPRRLRLHQGVSRGA